MKEKIALKLILRRLFQKPKTDTGLGSHKDYVRNEQITLKLSFKVVEDQTDTKEDQGKRYVTGIWRKWSTDWQMKYWRSALTFTQNCTALHSKTDNPHKRIPAQTYQKSHWSWHQKSRKGGKNENNKALDKWCRDTWGRDKKDASWSEKSQDDNTIQEKRYMKDTRNCRPGSLLSHMFKLFTWILQKWMEKVLNETQPREQANSRKGYWTVDHLQTINQLIENYNEFNRPLCIGYSDYDKHMTP